MMNRTRFGAGVIACAVACCLLAACGSASSSSSSTAVANAASGGAAGAAGINRTKFVACLKQHGVTLPARPPGAQRPPSGSGAPGSGGPGSRPPGGFRFGFGGRFRSSPKLEAAFKACGGAFGGRFRGGFGGRPRRQLINQFVTCVRQHGYNLPAPNLSGSGPVFPPKIQSDPKFRAASRACAKLLVPRPGLPQSSSSTSGSNA
jgi:hypothetical protein